MPRLIAYPLAFFDKSKPSLTSLLALWARLQLGYIFFSAGVTRLKDWDSQTFLFTEIHPIPLFSPLFSAIIATAGEIIFPILLFLGLGTRIGALGLLGMTLTIQFIVGQTEIGQQNSISNPIHYYWIFMSLYLFLHGGGKLSLDALRVKFLTNKQDE